MAALLLVLVAGLILEVSGLPTKTTEENTGAVFVSPQAAHMVLHRQRRFNSGHLEEVLQDNLERECKEEVCTMEEAREVFENDEKTMEFWSGYIDGDQCKPKPCLNEGTCEDGIGSYNCWCKPSFSGKNCEIKVTMQCSVNNGGCSHFCVVKDDVPMCQCAYGYILKSDKRSCVPEGAFSCGHVSVNPRSLSTSQTLGQSYNFSSNDYYDDSNITQLLYDYYDLHGPSLNESDPLNISVDVRSVRSNSSIKPDEVGANRTDGNQLEMLSSAFFPGLPTVKERVKSDERIVGGDEATPGQIPWQVALMSHSASLGRARPFCGGSLLSELWVITAAHCLVENKIAQDDYFVRAGEHDVSKDEGSERDYLVGESYIHPSYDYNKSPYNHDIALLKLANPVELSDFRRPICLGPKDFTENILRDSSSSLVSGWGRMAFNGLEATKLQMLEIPYVDRTRCKESSRYHVTRFMFCAGFGSAGKDSCQGDSGGPHATNYNGMWFLTGIVSWGEECAKDGKYGVYTRVSRYYPWISQTTQIKISS